jgi:SagB-type dehydrogenase family enzyme
VWGVFNRETKEEKMKVIPLLILALFLVCTGGNNMEDTFALPDPIRTNRSIEECLALRRSVRAFTSDTLTHAQISTLLWAAQGVTDTTRNTSRGFRTAPSAGATYPLETYIVVPQGIFHYVPSTHQVKLLKAGDSRAALAAACLNQQCVLKAPCSIVLCAVPERTSERYGERAMRYIYMEAGHAAQNVHLEAVALGLGSVPVGAFDDDALAKFLELNTAEQKTIPLYVISIGVPADTSR